MRSGSKAVAALAGTTVVLALMAVNPLAAQAAPAPASTTIDASLGLTNPANKLNPGPLNLGNGRLVITPGDPSFADEASEIADKVADKAATVTVDPEAIANPALTPPDPTQPQPDDPEDYLIPESASQFPGVGGAQYSIPEPAAGGTAAGTVPAGLEKYYNQQITWTPCETAGLNYDPTGGDTYAGYECGYAIVPIDYTDPDGPTAAIGMLKNPASSGTSKGSVLIDPGGPGSSGMETATWLPDMAPTLHEDFDFVGFDPRGVGSSLPMIRCKSSAAFDAQREGSDGLSAEQLDAILQQNTEDCYENTGQAFGIDGKEFIANVGTKNVVQDLDILKSTLGDPKINYLGFSYGTSIGYQYALKFPDNIRAMVIDGVVNPVENNPAEAAKYAEYAGAGGSGDPLGQIKGFQATFEQFAQQCAADGGFETETADGTVQVPCALGEPGTSVEQMILNYQAISQKAYGATTYATSEETPRPVSFADVTTGTIMAMYSTSLWPTLNSALTDLKESGDGTLIMSLADYYYNRDEAGMYNFSDSAFQTIWCTDTGTPAGANDDPQTAIDLLQEQYDVAPFTDPGTTEDGQQRGLEPSKDWCTFYETQHDLPAGQTLSAMPNILVISTTYDPATPYQDGVVGAAVVGGTLLTAAGNSHTSYGRIGCVTQITDAYFNTLIVPTDITGAAGVQTKDVHSNVITGNECQVTDQFRPVPSLTGGSVEAGQTVTVQASGLVRNTAYVIDSPFAAAAPTADVAVAAANAAIGTFTSDVNGTLSVPVTVPAGTPAGTYAISLAPADLTANDPTVTASGEIVVVHATTPAQPSTPDPGATGDPAAPGNGSGGAADKGGKGSGPLAITGVDASPMLATSALLLVAGAGFLLAGRRRSAR